MKKIITISLLSAMCALQSCETGSTEYREVEKIIYQDPTYDVKSISLSENSLLFKTKETALESKTLTLSIEGEEEIPTAACFVNSTNKEVATAELNDKGEVVITPVDKGTTEIVVTLQNKVATCAVEVRTTYFDLKFAKAICDSNASFVRSDNGDIDINTDENIAAIKALTTLDVSGKGLTSLAGIEHLTELEGLNCAENSLVALDVTQCTKLIELNCSQNSLTSLDLTKCTQLMVLGCELNFLPSLDVTKCTKMTTLSCFINFLPSLDVTKCTKMTTLYCNHNSLTSLDISACSGLSVFNCGSQLSGELTLSLTQSQLNGVWAEYKDERYNASVVTKLTEAN